ncbi:MAG: tRNA (adenosine(37)-N6)-threonylcarbamoyltransferase complex ATPase subunit type 1 TsaE [Silicimonas sp.]|nr:tRNA (adenosine(37)-N6)-threonylcarbamoyltransferase complex ATPase subunit type 1 TsaE [Silicimonas sp.]
MSANFSASIFLPDETATDTLGLELSKVLEAGDALLLSGPVGAGKSHLARAIIKARLDREEDVPSPTYTLVQTYLDETGTEIWHADLYRLGDTSEIAELGLEDAFSNAICLVEWADRLGDRRPKDALSIMFKHEDSGRSLTLASTNFSWAKVSRALERTEFLIDANWQAALMSDVAGDLSSRSYRRLRMADQTAILMDAGDDPVQTVNFVKMTHWLRGAGYSAPEIISENTKTGLLLLEDFGDVPLSDYEEIDNQLSVCIDLLADIRQQPCPKLYSPSVAELVEMTALSNQYPGAGIESLEVFRRSLHKALEEVMAGVPATVSLRDFHADNIMWLGERSGIQRLGMLDYQDAFLTHPVYDLVSLLTDARRDVPRALRDEMIAYYADLTGDNPSDLIKAFAVFSVQRNLRILGIFARAAIVNRKNHHVKNLPRVYDYLSEAVEHPIFSDSGALLLSALPKPDEALLAHLAA